MLRVCLPWQWAEKDAGYYDRVRARLGNPFFYNHKHDLLSGDPATRYTPMLYACKRDGHFDRALMAARTYPRRMWLIGNEPERADQSDTSPAEFAKAAALWAAQTAGRSFMALPGILWGDEGRAWLEGYLAQPNRTIPGVWAIHIYGSSTPEAWDAQYRHAQRWFAEHKVSRPVWPTETNCYSPDPARAIALMRYLHDRTDTLIWWYASRDPFLGMASNNLHDAIFNPTPLGRAFAALQQPAYAPIVAKAKGNKL